MDEATHFFKIACGYHFTKNAVQLLTLQFTTVLAARPSVYFRKQNLINSLWLENQVVFYKIMKMLLDKPIFTTVTNNMTTLESLRGQEQRILFLKRCLRNSIIPSFATNRHKVSNVQVNPLTYYDLQMVTRYFKQPLAVSTVTKTRGTSQFPIRFSEMKQSDHVQRAREIVSAQRSPFSVVARKVEFRQFKILISNWVKIFKMHIS